MADIVLKDVSKAYGAVQVLDKVNMHIRSGEFIVFLGPSGCGKSTLLRMIAGLEAVNDGEIHIGERRVDNLPPNQRGVAMVFQNYALYPHMSVRQNMSFGLENIGTEKAEIARRVEPAPPLSPPARNLPVGDQPGTLGNRLSRGEARKHIGIGRSGLAYAFEPRGQVRPAGTAPRRPDRPASRASPSADIQAAK